MKTGWFEEKNCFNFRGACRKNRWRLGILTKEGVFIKIDQTIQSGIKTPKIGSEHRNGVKTPKRGQNTGVKPVGPNSQLWPKKIPRLPLYIRGSSSNKVFSLLSQYIPEQLLEHYHQREKEGSWKIELRSTFIHCAMEKNKLPEEHSESLNFSFSVSKIHFLTSSSIWRRSKRGRLIDHYQLAAFATSSH